MATRADTMSARSASPSKRASSGKASGFERVYQACENCRQKKQRCILGDPANPKPPCRTCRRANLLCVLPEKKRKGRPPKKTREELVRGKADTVVATPSKGDFKSPDIANEADEASQPAWQTFMGSFEPVVGTGDNASTRISHSTTSLSQKQPTSYDQQMASETLATFPLRNTSDAIRLLDQAEVNSDDQAQNALNAQEDPISGEADTFGASSSSSSFFLLQEGFIDETTLLRLFRFYLGSVHPIMPLIPYKRMPITPEHTLAMASREPHFMAAILVVTASLAGDQALHDLLWKRAKSLFAEVAIIGANASMEVIEGLLLLSEYPPNVSHRTGLGLEDRICWMTVGTAVRLGYLLGLEQLGMQAEDVDEKLVDNRDRGRVVWSYCYCLDRQISIRVGKAFWHRSPGMTYQHLHVDPAEDFPEMRVIPGIQDDYAAYLQCLIHITQVLSNAHDLLYPSKSRSIALAKAEHYYKHIDEFTETLSAFRNRWQKKPWRTYPINECVWISFHHLRLYIYSFSLQAYMQRVSSRHDGNRPLDYFPTGLMGHSDARFIIEAINAAADVLRLAIGRLQPLGALSYVPLRFFLFCSHAGVFLLKAAVIVPLPPLQKRAILRLIRALIGCMSTASTDPRHPGVRYSSALNSLLGRIYRDRDPQTPGLTRPPSPQMGSGVNANWSESTVINPPENDLPALLGSKESPFVAERPFRDLAADIDALFGLTPDDHNIALQPATENGGLSTLLHPSDPFSSLFSDDDREFWEPFTWTTLDWDMVQGNTGTI